MACKIQMDVLATGREPVLVSDAIVEGLYGDSGMPYSEPAGARVWPSLIRMLDRNGSDFRE